MERGSTDIEVNFASLQDEVNLLKNEVKQTLVDLREYIMKERTIFPRAAAEPVAESAGDQEHMPAAHDSALPAIPQGPAPSGEALDPTMMSNVIWWLETVKRRGLSLQQIAPYLEAYELGGYLSSAMSKLVLRSLADLDQIEEFPPNHTFSPQDYAECLGQFHEIVCSEEYPENGRLPEPRAESREPAPRALPTRGRKPRAP